MQNASYRILKLIDLICNKQHGPTKTGLEADIMMYVLRKGLHKMRTPDSKVVGNWRHKFFQLCSTGLLAMTLFVRYHQPPPNFHFYENNDKKTNGWRHEMLNQSWKDEKSCSAAYKAILEKLEIDVAKVTHLRSSAMEQGSAHGELGTNEISTM